MMRVLLLGLIVVIGNTAPASQPNIILVMADDQGWGQTGYYQHPVLKTPHMDAMAANGLRFDRFYAGAPNCSPTRATVLTGRSNDRCGVQNHGYALRLQEKTLVQALREADYATGHFGKWHLNGLRGPGVPVRAEDDHNPGAFGFEEWLSMSNFFDRDPIMSRNGTFEEFEGDSSEIIVTEALKFIRRQAGKGRPFLAVIWYGSPHTPWRASATDRTEFAALSEAEQHHYGELVAMDRSIGALRQGLREANIASNTLVWYCSDNGGLKPFGPATVGGLRGWKGTVFEGGLRVPCIVEWPAAIKAGRVTKFPAATLDIFPTLADIASLPAAAQLEPQDGISLRPLFEKEIERRAKPIPFRHQGRGAWIDNNYKLITLDWSKDTCELYDLDQDPQETRDLSEVHPEIARRMLSEFAAWNRSVQDSVAGKDYPAGRVDPADIEPRQWPDLPDYARWFDQWKARPEYQGELGKR